MRLLRRRLDFSERIGPMLDRRRLFVAEPGTVERAMGISSLLADDASCSARRLARDTGTVGGALKV